MPLAACPSRVIFALCLSHVAGSTSAAFSPSETLTPERIVFTENGSFFEYTACQEFEADSTVGSGWLLADCIDVWRSWASTVGEKTLSRKDDRQFFLGVSARLRQLGTPCCVLPPDNTDGAGSTSMRHLATTLYAEEMGCNYLLPKGYEVGPNIDGTRYCHAIEYKKDTSEIKDENFRCASVDWIAYFNFSDHMTALPDQAEEAKIINVRNPLNLQAAMDGFHERGGFHHPPWVHWILTPGNKASGYFIMPSTWNAGKLARVRDLLRRLRTNFQLNPRPRYPDGLNCNFSPSRINIAIHVRLGDRDFRQSSTSLMEDVSGRHDQYFDMLENFMGTVSEAVRRQGEALPVFHIFSETSEPCPSTETGSFEEFLRWPAEKNQIEECVAAVTPDECWEKTQGAPMCNPDRSGVFHVQGKDLHLHVGPDVENAMSCMIEADGLLMGCSTFGQVAGVFSEGVKFFSVGCDGWMTGPHYKMMPPMAIAEQGNMWVPVSGSWRDPAIESSGILNVALSQLFGKSRRRSEGPEP